MPKAGIISAGIVILSIRNGGGVKDYRLDGAWQQVPSKLSSTFITPFIEVDSKHDEILSKIEGAKVSVASKRHLQLGKGPTEITLKVHPYNSEPIFVCREIVVECFGLLMEPLDVLGTATLSWKVGRRLRRTRWQGCPGWMV